MTPYEELKGLSKDVVAAAWQQQCGHCRAVQERVLMDILARAKDTEIGRRFHFDQIKSIADHRRAGPAFGRRRTDRFRFQRQRPQEQYAAAHDLSVRDRPSSG